MGHLTRERRAEVHIIKRMTTSTPAPVRPALPHSTALRGEEVLFDFEGIRWETYELLRKDLDYTNIRLTYDRGRLVAVSPLPKHDKIKKLMARLVECAAIEKRVPISSFGSATWKHKELVRGLEADECYYVRREVLVRGRDDIVLPRDPAPDLAIEVDITHHPVDRLAIYAALDVTEVWVHDGKSVQFLELNQDGKYRPVACSGAFPFLTPADIDRFLAMFVGADENSVILAFRDWLRSLQ